MPRRIDSSIPREILKIREMSIKGMKAPIYLDHNATTPVDPRVREAMQPYLDEQFGNAASNSHSYGWSAQSAVAKARKQVADLLGCEARHVIWTSGATESNNMAILGVSRAMNGQKHHIITQATEHKAVLEVCEAAEDFGAEITVLGVDSEGAIRLDELERAIRPDTILISIMSANNEVGAIQPVDQIAGICRARKIIFHTDAAQSAGKVACNMQNLAADMISISAHKMYGPKGVGALVLRPINREFEIKPILFGGEQERGLRPGTLNVPGIVGLGMACEIARESFADESARLKRFQDRFIDVVTERFPQVRLNGPRKHRLCNNISFSFPDITPDTMALGLSGMAYSSGSACTSANPMPSHVLTAMGLSEGLSRSTLRLGTGRFTRPEDVETALDKIMKMLEKSYSKPAPRPL